MGCQRRPIIAAEWLSIGVQRVVATDWSREAKRIMFEGYLSQSEIMRRGGRAVSRDGREVKERDDLAGQGTLVYTGTMQAA